ncbi:uncharacterized protein LOC105167544 [Sesamum indicum]|uniref:Uncharacterized protein LOC105167544 n=1 Tax=Sesamum indicum TaxID=4182 RepID=A0A6I9TWA6_SESIN|nr:uncharacterized protein LOC105167544 [Sesamum indicum]
MAMPFLNLSDNSLNFEKFKKNPKKHSNLKSLWAFLLSIFIYISVLYIFNLSPSALFYTTNFWFFISNTLILIIAADFGEFSSSEDDHTFYQEYVKNTVGAKTAPSLQPQYVKIVEKTATNDQKEEVDEKPQEKIINMVVTTAVAKHDQNHQNKKNKHQSFIRTTETDVVDDEESRNNEKLDTKKEEMMISIKPEVGIGNPEQNMGDRRRCVGSNSENGVIMVAAAEDSEEKMVLRRTSSEKRDEEENEFSRMSDEELNRRVEEFIRRFNRQMRLQAAKTRRNSHQLMNPI